MIDQLLLRQRHCQGIIMIYFRLRHDERICRVDIGYVIVQFILGSILLRILYTTII